jgi:hypothetical protein
MAVTKRLVITLAVLAVILSFAFSSFAHSGGTDYKGGHHDRDTGDYHYHHGYPAHDHEDTDGDGELDCPYESENNEKENQGGIAQIQKSKEIKEPTKYTSPFKVTGDTNSDNSFDFLKYINSLFPSLFISFPLSAVIYYVLAKFNDNIKGVALIWIYAISTLIISIVMYQSN